MFYFICTENRKAPVTKVEFAYEAEEYRKHPFYEEVDADGNVIAKPSDAIKTSIPFTPGNTEPAPAKRPILSRKK